MEILLSLFAMNYLYCGQQCFDALQKKAA